MTKLDKTLSAIVDGFEQFLKYGSILLLTLGTLEQITKIGESYPTIVIPILLLAMIVLTLVAVHVVKKEL